MVRVVVPLVESFTLHEHAFYMYDNLATQKAMYKLSTTSGRV